MNKRTTAKERKIAYRYHSEMDNFFRSLCALFTGKEMMAAGHLWSDHHGNLDRLAYAWNLFST